MTGFIEVTKDGRPLLVSLDHVVRITKDASSGLATLELGEGLGRILCGESYDTVRAALGGQTPSLVQTIG